MQGYYYTFLNLLASQVFVELGFSTVIIQLAGHEWSKLSLDENRSITGDELARSRLINIAQITLRWFSIGSIIYVAGLCVGGYLFFSHAPSHSNIFWTLPWFTLVTLSGINVLLIPVWSLLEGCNQVQNVYKFRFFQTFLSYLAIWSSIMLGGNLWTPSFSSVVAILFSLYFFVNQYRSFLKMLIFTRQSIQHVNWWEDIFPFQWRIALSWISGYLCFNLFTPVLLQYHGASVAGQMGMTWNIASMIGLIAASWVYPRVPTFCMLIAEKEYRKLDELFFRITRIVIFIAVLCSVVIGAAIYLLNFLNHPLAHRLLPPLPAALIICGQAVQTITIPASSYLRAHKKEPLLILSTLSAVLICVMVFTAGRYYSATGISVGYFVLSILLNPWVFIIWNRCRREWHTYDNE